MNEYNEDFDIIYAIENPDQEWDWRYLTSIASKDQITKYCSLPWNWEYIKYGDNRNYIDDEKFVDNNKENLSSRYKLNINKKLNNFYKYLRYHPHNTAYSSDTEENVMLFNNKYKYFALMTNEEHIPNYVLEHPIIESVIEDIYIVQNQPDFNLQYAINNPNYNWEWDYLTHLADKDTITKNNELPWDWLYIIDLNSCNFTNDEKFMKENHKYLEKYLII